MGRIIAPFGVKGWVRVQPNTAAIRNLLAYGTWTLPWQLTDLTVYYERSSGVPYSYVASGDLEAAAGVVERCREALSEVSAEETRLGERVREALSTMRVLDDLVRLNDVRVTEADGQPRLVAEHRDEVGIAGQVRPDALEDHQLAAFGRGQQHLRHATAADGDQGAVTRRQWARERPGMRVIRHHGHDCHGAKVRPAD